MIVNFKAIRIPLKARFRNLLKDNVKTMSGAS